MPYPLVPIKQQYDLPEAERSAQDMSNIFPLLVDPSSLLQHLLVGNDSDKKKLKELWTKSKTREGGVMHFSSMDDIIERDVKELQYRGIVKDISRGDGMGITLTDRGSKLLRDAILNDEQSSFTKKASKELLAKNSYDFGEKVLTRINNKVKLGSRYVMVSKKAFKKRKLKPIQIEDYIIATTGDDGEQKQLSEYTEMELVKTLHLAISLRRDHRRVTSTLASRQLGTFPINKLKTFALMIMKELNSR